MEKSEKEQNFGRCKYKTDLIIATGMIKNIQGFLTFRNILK